MTEMMVGKGIGKKVGEGEYRQNNGFRQWRRIDKGDRNYPRQKGMVLGGQKTSPLQLADSNL